jgi:hypothetical protein
MKLTFLALLALLAVLGLAQAQDIGVTKLKVSGSPSQSANLTDWYPPSGNLPITYSTAPLYVGATTAEQAPYVITYDPKTKALTIMQRNGNNVAGGKVLVVCNPTSCTKEPQ